MERPEGTELLTRAIRRTLGISVALYAFYLAAPFFIDIPPLTSRDVTAILTVVFLGVWLGIGFSTVWPVPAEKGLPRAIRTVLLTIPAIGFGLAFQVAIEGARGSRAFYIMFALAAWLGSLFVREGEGADGEGEDADDEGEGADGEGDPAARTDPEPTAE